MRRNSADTNPCGRHFPGPTPRFEELRRQRFNISIAPAIQQLHSHHAFIHHVLPPHRQGRSPGNEIRCHCPPTAAKGLRGRCLGQDQAVPRSAASGTYCASIAMNGLSIWCRQCLWRGIGANNWVAQSIYKSQDVYVPAPSRSNPLLQIEY
jgi:hypothetical protein